MGEVYRAEDTKLGQEVALKFVRGTLSGETLSRLYDEVKIGRQVSHPSVCRLHDIVEHAGHTFLAMEYVDGEDLASLLGRIGRLSPERVLEITRDLLSGLTAVHEKGFVHRDLKPANVMIDGHGRAHVTDFGLAVSLGEARGSSAGTPPYMAPEQFEGRATAKSDLYALGLVIFEMLTGQRFFGAKTLEGLRTEHREAKAPRLSSFARVMDLGLGGLIVECLEEDPEARPPSARSVLSRLPIGDPLDAAVAAGETPSPETVAAAGTIGNLHPLQAWLFLLMALGGAWLNGHLSDGTLLRKAQLPKSPEILAEHARGILARLGQTERVDFASSFLWNPAYIDYVATHDSSPSRFDALSESPFSPFEFAYRQSPTRLIAENRDAMVLREDPPADVPGMAGVVLDPRGPLRRFLAVPPQVEGPRPEWGQPEWSVLFREAGLDPSLFHRGQPAWAAPVDSDEKAAWEGFHAAQPNLPLRIEAAAYHGRPVWFEVLPPWAAGRLDVPRGVTPATPLAQTALFFLVLVMPAGSVLLARRNLRLGRGDRSGAFRVALAVFLLYSLARLFRANHVSAFSEEVWILIKVFAYPCFWSLQVWLLYVALEPFARRRWPRTLISWKRLLAGRIRDPLVGRDILVGAALGTLSAVLLRLAWLRSSPQPYGKTWIMASLRYYCFEAFVNAFSAVLYGMAFLFLLVLLRIVLRKEWLALAGLCLILAGPVAGETLVFGALRALVLILVLRRVGLLALTSALFFFFCGAEVPITGNLSAWYAPGAFLVFGLGALVALYAFHTSLAGQSPLGSALQQS
jgi:serine/threonine-protein kinase